MEDNITFANIKAVAEYLKAEGWKIKKSSVYEHVKRKRLHPQKDGTYRKKDVDRYAGTYLRQLADGAKSLPVKFEKLQEKKLVAEADKLEAQARHWELRTKVASGQYVEKFEFERALAQRAALFKSDIEAFIRGTTPERVALVGGDPDKIPDLIEHDLDQFEKCLGRYAEDREFVIPAMAPIVEPDETNREDEHESDDEEDLNCGKAFDNQETGEKNTGIP